MTDLAVVGGFYHEWSREGPGVTWDELLGSGLRAAASIVQWVTEPTLYCYASENEVQVLQSIAGAHGVHAVPHARRTHITFAYDHALSTPRLTPEWHLIQQEPAFQVRADAALVFGMVEGSPIVHAGRVVYDPQSPSAPRGYAFGGSTSKELLIVGNSAEIRALGGNRDPVSAAKNLLGTGAIGVIIKAGFRGLTVVTQSTVERLPAFYSSRVWSVGSGDIFSGVVAAEWIAAGKSVVDAAESASRSVALYAESPRTLAVDRTNLPKVELTPMLARSEASDKPVYLASPFFSMGERWVVDQIRDGLLGLGVRVFSPFHDVGTGSGVEVAPKDIAGLRESQAVIAVLDGLDPGTIFEVGYARSLGLPVICFAQNVAEEPLKMIVGSDCVVVPGFVTAVYYAAWQAHTGRLPER